MVGLINVQFAIRQDVVYVIEVNPRASRTVPFVSKATAVQLAKAAARIALGTSIAQLRAEGRTASVPFSSARKWSAASFTRHGTWVLGAPEMVLPAEQHALLSQAAELASDGHRVLVLARADAIISSIPYSLLPETLRREIVNESRQALKAEGSLLVFQYNRTLLPYLKSSFTTVRLNFQLLNILPVLIFHCTP